MKRHVSATKGSIEVLLQEAVEAWKRREYEESIELLNKARTRDPHDSSVLLELGRAYGMRYDYANAERSFEMAIRASSRQTEMLIAAGRRCQEFGRDEMAWHYFERALERPDASVEMFIALAELHERHNQLGR